MSKAAQLKKKASEFEHKKQYDRALMDYVQAIEASAGLPDETDISLYNRVGDLHLRLGDLDQAVAYYEMAIDLYAEGGFFNNAIALCNKVLRHAPSRSVIYYKLGKISAKKGFNSDAKQNFLDYADRMQKGGDADEAFRALKEFADLCPGQDEVRLMLAEQLGRIGRTGEALEQLQIVHDIMVTEDRMAEAAATLERMRVLDPAAELKPAQTLRQTTQDRLVFIDVSDEGSADSTMSDDTSQANSTLPIPVVPERPLTAEEFGSVALPPPADARVVKTLDESPIDRIVPLEVPAIVPGPSVLDEPLQEFAPPAIPVSSIVDDPTSLHRQLDGIAGTADSSPLSPLEGLEPTAQALPEDLTYVAGLSLLEETPPAEEGKSDLAPGTPSTGANDGEFIDLQAWLLETEPPKSPRMIAEGETQPPPGAIQTDFTEMLEAFKRGVAQNLEESDVESQYDLGVAYMEMGLLDEAIAQFQTAIRGNTTSERRVRAYESLGQCFIERKQYDIAVTSLNGALRELGGGEDKLVGILYLLGYASESQERWGDAVAYYQRVFAVDIHFRDVSDRLQRARAATQGGAS